MKIVVPYAYTNARSNPAGWDAARLNFELQGIHPHYVNVASSFVAYSELVRDLWAEGEPFIIVEHDILPWPGALEELWECDCAWGAFSYLVCNQYRTYIGCMKFDPSRLGPVTVPITPWYQLDRRLIREVLRAGTYHPHGPPVIHLNAEHRAIPVVLP